LLHLQTSLRDRAGEDCIGRRAEYKARFRIDSNSILFYLLLFLDVNQYNLEESIYQSAPALAGTGPVVLSQPCCDLFEKMARMNIKKHGELLELICL